MNLNEVCTIQLGYTPRGRLETTEDEGTLAIQLRDLTGDGPVRTKSLSRFILDGVSDRYLVRPGDVLFRSRGEQNTAVAVDRHLTEPALAILPIVILRPHPSLVLAPFLAWTLNQVPAQRHFALGARGSNIRMVPRSSLDTLEVELPDIATQRLIIEIDTLSTRERELSIEAALKRHELVNMILMYDPRQRAIHAHERNNQ